MRIPVHIWGLCLADMVGGGDRALCSVLAATGAIQGPFENEIRVFKALGGGWGKASQVRTAAVSR